MRDLLIPPTIEKIASHAPRFLSRLFFSNKLSWQEEMEILVKQGANPNTPLRTEEGKTYFPMQLAIRENLINLLRLLLHHGADPNTCYSNTVSILMHATCRESPEAVAALLYYGADPNYKNECGITALSYAHYKSTKQSLSEEKIKIA